MKAVTSLLALALMAGASAQTRMIVRLAPGADATAVAARHSITLLDTASPAPFALYVTAASQDEDAVQAALNLDPLVVWAEDDDNLSITENTAGTKGSSIAAIADRDALYGQNTNALGQVKFSPNRSAGVGRRVRVAILDTGISRNQPRLWAKVVASLNAVEPGQPAHDVARGQDTNGNGQRDESLGHGTMVAGIIDQIAPQVDLVVARVADSDGYGTAWSLLKGLAFAVVERAEVANISLGSVQSIPALSDVMDWTEENNLLVVASIGNNGSRMALDPAGISKVICVTGIDASSKKASFSNWEGTADVAAPATGIKSTWHDGTMGVWSGTSFAAPFVTAGIADSLRRTRPLSISVIRNAVRRAGDNIDGLNSAYRGRLGGRLNLLKLDAYIRRRR